MSNISRAREAVQEAIAERGTFTAWSLKKRIGNITYDPVVTVVRCMFTMGEMPGYDRHLVTLHLDYDNVDVQCFEYFPVEPE